MENEIEQPVVAKPKAPRKRAAPKETVCEFCGHSLVDNDHGPDQNDFEVADDGKAVHSGNCTYCKECRESHPVIEETTPANPTDVLPPPKSKEKPDYRFCKHSSLKKDKYGKDIQEFHPGRGMVSYCALCGVKITTFHTGEQPGAKPKKVHMSKKDRRLGRKIQKEVKNNPQFYQSTKGFAEYKNPQDTLENIKKGAEEIQKR